jgi:hypothetical protein
MLLQFILDYPLGTKRLQHHLQFLITNLSFEHESGRQAAVDTITVIPSAVQSALGDSELLSDHGLHLCNQLLVSEQHLYPFKQPLFAGA